MKFKNEKQLLLALRYTLPLFILFFSIVITIFLYFENKQNFENIKKNTEEKFISDKKLLIKEQVDNLYDYIISEQEDTVHTLKATLIDRIHEAHIIISNIYKQYKDTHSKEEITLMIRSVIKDIRFNNDRGYFFVYDTKAVNIIHPLVPKLEGKNLINHKDTKGTYVLRESLSLLEKYDEAYQEWYWRKVKNDLTEYRKIGFVKNIYDLGWFIGTGEYVEDFSKDIQRKVLSQIKKLKFGNNGHYTVFDENNKYLNHIDRSYIGKEISFETKIHGSGNILDEISALSEKEGSFLSLDVKEGSKTFHKISYAKYIPQWNWIISTGFYKADIDKVIEEQRSILAKKYKENFKNILLVAVSICLFLLILSLYISRIIENKFKRYKISIEQHINENQKQYELLSQKSKLAAMGEMMENIAHQWRQPLSLITTASSGIKFQKELDILNDKFLLESVDIIGNSAIHLSETIEDFRDFFRTDKLKIIFELESAIEKTFKLLSSQIKKNDIHVVQDIKSVTIEGLQRELLQVLLNILNNAKDAFSEEMSDKYIFIDIYSENEKAVIKIKDNAGGIPPDVINKIFEAYFTTKDKSKGTGLGLYMSQEIISRNMNGELKVENSTYEYKGKTYTGALFTIILPLK